MQGGFLQGILHKLVLLQMPIILAGVILILLQELGVLLQVLGVLLQGASLFILEGHISSFPVVLQGTSDKLLQVLGVLLILGVKQTHNFSIFDEQIFLLEFRDLLGIEDLFLTRESLLLTEVLMFRLLLFVFLFCDSSQMN